MKKFLSPTFSKYSSVVIHLYVTSYVYGYSDLYYMYIYIYTTARFKTTSSYSTLIHKSSRTLIKILSVFHIFLQILSKTNHFKKKKWKAKLITSLLNILFIHLPHKIPQPNRIHHQRWSTQHPLMQTIYLPSFQVKMLYLIQKDLVNMGSLLGPHKCLVWIFQA